MFFLFPCFSLSAVNLEMRSGGLWVVANVNVTGYYRVNYDLGNWESLFAQLKSEHQVHNQAGSFYYLMDAEPPIKLCSALSLRFCFSCLCFNFLFHYLFSVFANCILIVCISYPVWHIKSGLQVIPVINRAQLVDDAFNLARYVSLAAWSFCCSFSPYVHACSH